MSSEREEELRRGLQRERTALAWNRTGLSVILAGALLVRANLDRGLLLVPGFLAAAIGAGLLVLADQRYERHGVAIAAGETPISPRLVRALGLGVLLICAAALATVLAALMTPL